MHRSLFAKYKVDLLKSSFIACCAVLSLFLINAQTLAAPAAMVSQRSPEFQVPERLRPRVNFWISIFARYGQYQRVVHHRIFPQIVFKVIDFSREAETLGPVAIESVMARVEKEKVAEINAALRNLATGASPQNIVEQQVVTAMAPLGPGTAKYQRAVDEDLVRTQTGIREKFAESIKRSGRYLHFMEDIFVREYGLPKELTRIPFIESSFDYNAYSSVGAAGIWQFMRQTARGQMIVNANVDERRDPIAASRAAARYLKGAYQRLGSWPQAITSYNHGVAGVAKKMRDLGTNDMIAAIEHPTERPFGFASSNFYPEFLAALEVYENYRRYFPDLEREQPLYLKQYRITRPMSVIEAARQVGVTAASLREGNYALAETVWSGRAKIPVGYVLKVPTQSSVMTAQMAEIGASADATTSTQVSLNASSEPPETSSSIYGGIVYTVRKGDTLQSIAKRHGITLAALKSQNNISGNNISIGRQLRIGPYKGGAVSIEKKNVAPNVSAPKPAVAQPKRSYRVKSGDTLWSVAARYGTTAEKIRKANNLGKKKPLKPGQQLIIP